MSGKKRPLASWTLYDHPRDFPDEYVARLFEDGKPTRLALRCAELEPLRNYMRERGLVRFTRAESDSPVIIETWL